MFRAAHSCNRAGARHDLVTHLRSVAALAAGFAESFGGGEAGYWSGLWHDVGKFPEAFQRYLAACEANPDRRERGPDHKAAGSVLAREHLQLAAPIVQGHHGGLKSRIELRNWLAERLQDPATMEAIRLATAALPDLWPRGRVSLPEYMERPLTAEFFIRMVFSALVDADYLDTERHFNVKKFAARRGAPSLAELWRRFEADQVRLPRRDNALGRARAEIYRACLAAADQPVGLKRLSAPTGSGKTRSAMAFALRHTLAHGLERVIVAVPYISITTQTAEVYRGVFGADAVLEHHSQVEWPDDEHGDCYDSAIRSRLAAENWDAPIIVTTTVQLFESMFSNRTSATRKLHRLARSVIILDEAQSLPPYLLTPILDGLRELCTHYGSTVVLSTATQPAFDVIRGFAELRATEILPNCERLFQGLRRVEYERLLDPVPWSTVAQAMRGSEQCLAIVNTRADALSLLDALADSRALHLSTNLCGAHRAVVLATLRQRLANGEPCRLVSTQCIEAGVDTDFPLVLRAMGPLDSIIQAAGRCNREWRLDRGRVVVFEPVDGGLPPGSYTTAAGVSRALLAGGQQTDLDDLALMATYFQRLYAVVNTDREQIQQWRRSFDYPEVADRFRMIDEDKEEVIVRYGSPAEQWRVQQLVEQLRAGTAAGRYIMRQLQPYLVSVWRRDADKCRSQGLIAEITDGLGEWLGGYDSIRGVQHPSSRE